MDQYLKDVDTFVDLNFDELWEISSYIHANPELAFNEHKSAKVQVDYLRSKGFEVQAGTPNLDTSFVAEFKSGTGYPTIAIVSEYDALPIGHACGHNLISTSALGTAIAVKDFLEKSKMNCTLKVMGTPAEETGGGKIIMLEHGVFDGIDAVLMMHPTSDTSRLAGACLSSKRINAKFIGKSSHGGAHPEKGINALSAASLFLNASGMLRQQMKGDARLSAIITNGGETTGLVPETSEIEVSFSCFNLNDLEHYSDILSKCVEGSALAMGCSVEYEVIDGYQGRVPNAILSDICREELTKIGEPLMDGMPVDFGGEDLGNVSRVIPICNPYISIFPEYKISNHTDQFRELAISDNGKHCLDVTSKGMARTCIRLIFEPEIIDRAKEELKVRLEKE